jgi:outer membrane lipoprotein carrier protein
LKRAFFRTVITSLLFIAMTGLSLPALSKSAGVDDSIDKIQKAYEKIKDMKGSFTQKNTIKDLNQTDTYKGEFFIRQPLRMKWVYTGKAAQDIFIGNDTVMIYKKGDKQAYKGKFDKETYGQTPVALLSGFGNIRQEFTITGRGNSLLLKPKKNLGNITSISITLSDDDFPIKSFVIQDGESNVIEIALKDVKTNTGLKDPIFEFSLPKGVKVYDYNP